MRVSERVFRGSKW